MWFKNIQIFTLKNTLLDQHAFSEMLTPLAFIPCLPSFFSSEGWISPTLDENAPLVYSLNDCMMFCFQIEEKIMPASVVRKEVDKKAKELEALRDKKISQKEKYALKEEMILTLLPKAFTRLIQIHAYIDAKKRLLIINTSNMKRAQQLISCLKKSWTDFSVEPISEKKIGQMLTRWLIHHEYPSIFSIEKSCVLIDPADQTRLVRCQQQNLSDQGIQLIAKNGCEVKQIGLSWQDRVKFMLVDDFSIRSIKFDGILMDEANELEPENKAQKFAADSLIMTETLRNLVGDLHQTMAV